MAATLFTIPKQIQFQTTAVASGAKANFFITGTTTRQNTFTDKALTIAHDNPVVADAFGVFPPIYLNDTLNYKVDITDSLNNSLTGYPVDDLASSATLVADLASNANALGLSLVGIEDAAGNFIATNAEAALAEVYTDFASTANALGASLFGIEDAAGIIIATTVEAALAEIVQTSLNTVTKFKTSTTSKATDITLADDPDLAGWALTTSKHYSIEAYLAYDQSVGNFQFKFDFSDTPVVLTHQMTTWASDETQTQYNDTHIGIENTVSITTMVDGEFVGLKIDGVFQANVTTGGTLDFQWAQDTSDGNNTRLKQGSWIRVSKLD